MFEFKDLKSEEMKKLFVEYSYVTLGGDVVVPPSEEIERVINDGHKANIAAIRELNPAYDYMRIYAAGSWDFPRTKSGDIAKGHESDDWKVAMRSRENSIKRIVNSSPEKMKYLN